MGVKMTRLTNSRGEHTQLLYPRLSSAEAGACVTCVNALVCNVHTDGAHGHLLLVLSKWGVMIPQPAVHHIPNHLHLPLAQCVYALPAAAGFCVELCVAAVVIVASYCNLPMS